MNPDTIGCVWTGEFDLNTLRVDGEVFESGKKKLRIQKYPDTCGRGLSINLLAFYHEGCSLTSYATQYLFLNAIDHSLYGFTGAINRVRCWENTREACKSRAVRRVIYKLVECSPNIPSGLLRC